MYLGFLEEGDLCPECIESKMIWPDTVNCACHVHPPCSACTNKVLCCPGCGWEDEPEPYKHVEVAPGLSMREYRPRQLDKTKIDYRSKMHTGSSMIKEGCFPDGKTRGDVEAIVKGTFGGRFESFGNNHFKYIAYTD